MMYNMSRFYGNKKKFENWSILDGPCPRTTRTVRFFSSVTVRTKSELVLARFWWLFNRRLWNYCINRKKSRFLTLKRSLATLNFRIDQFGTHSRILQTKLHQNHTLVEKKFFGRKWLSPYPNPTHSPGSASLICGCGKSANNKIFDALTFAWTNFFVSK